MENVYELPCQLLSCAKKMLKRNDKILLYEQGGRKWDKLWTRAKLLYVSMCARMGVFVFFTNMRPINVRINLRCSNVAVPQ